MKLAIIETGGKQYLVRPGDKIKIEKTAEDIGKEVVFDKVLLSVDDDKIQIGKPYLKTVKVKGKILEQGREKKKIVFRYHSKTRYRKKKGHRQYYTKIEIL